MLSACGSADNSPTQEARVIRMGLATMPSNLDPRFATDASSERINLLLYDQLVAIDQSALPEPALASWQQLSLQHYRFSLAENLPRFTDGRELTVDDVLATYSFVLDEKNLSPLRQPIEHISALNKISAREFDVLLSHVDPLLPARMTLSILPADLMANNHDFNRQPVGSGKFEFVERDSDQRIGLIRRDDKQHFEFIRVKEPVTRVLKLMRGEIDLLQNDIPPELSGYLQKSADIKCISEAGSNFSYIGFNMSDPLTGDPRIRKAIAMAIDRQAIIQYVFHGAARTAETILPPGHWAGHKQLPVLDYNPGKARELLGAAGFNEHRPLVITYKTSSDPFRIKLATIIQAQLAKVGINVKIMSYDWGTFFGDIKKGNFQMYSLTWVGVKTPDIYQRVFHSSSLPPAGANRGRYESPVADQLLDKIAAGQTLNQRADLYYKLQALLHDELVYIPLWYEHQQAFMKNDIVGYQLQADGNYSALNNVRRQ